MKEEFKIKIIESLKKGGFPTELKVGKVLNQREWFNISNSIYIDKDKNISREIDFYCIKQPDSNDYLKARFEAHLVVEVKKSDKPWPFLFKILKKKLAMMGLIIMINFQALVIEILISIFGIGYIITFQAKIASLVRLAMLKYLEILKFLIFIKQ